MCKTSYIFGVCLYKNIRLGVKRPEGLLQWLKMHHEKFSGFSLSKQSDTKILSVHFKKSISSSTLKMSDAWVTVQGGWGIQWEHDKKHMES